MREQRDAQDPQERLLDEISKESFPASDPPGHGSVTGNETASTDLANVAILHNQSASRFEAHFPEGIAVLDYQRGPGGALVMYHTEVPPALRHHGVASQLAKHALEYARQQGAMVIPQCSFVARYIEEHPEYADLVAIG